MKRFSFLLHALSPLHCGTGQGVEVIDLPIARMHATGIPIVPGTSLKGVLRSMVEARTADEGPLFAVFGPGTANASDNAGAFVVGDARLLLLPVRSFRGTFAWVTSPLLLHLAARDLSVDHRQLPEVPTVKNTQALLPSEKHANIFNRHVYLQDLQLLAELTDREALKVAQWTELLAKQLPTGEADLLRSRMVVVDDEIMAFLWETATQVDARNRLNEQGTVVDGALWYEESLPPETILVGQFAAERTRRKGVAMDVSEIMEFVFPADKKHILQVGGKATVGRGICSVHLGSPAIIEELAHA